MAKDTPNPAAALSAAEKRAKAENILPRYKKMTDDARDILFSLASGFSFNVTATNLMLKDGHVVKSRFVKLVNSLGLPLQGAEPKDNPETMEILRIAESIVDAEELAAKKAARPPEPIIEVAEEPPADPVHPEPVAAGPVQDEPVVEPAPEPVAADIVEVEPVLVVEEEVLVEQPLLDQAAAPIVVAEATWVDEAAEQARAAVRYAANIRKLKPDDPDHRLLRVYVKGVPVGQMEFQLPMTSSEVSRRLKAIRTESGLDHASLREACLMAFAKGPLPACD